MVTQYLEAVIEMEKSIIKIGIISLLFSVDSDFLIQCFIMLCSITMSSSGMIIVEVQINVPFS